MEICNDRKRKSDTISDNMNDNINDNMNDNINDTRTNRKKICLESNINPQISIEEANLLLSNRFDIVSYNFAPMLDYHNLINVLVNVKYRNEHDSLIYKSFIIYLITNHDDFDTVTQNLLAYVVPIDNQNYINQNYINQKNQFPRIPPIKTDITIESIDIHTKSEYNNNNIDIVYLKPMKEYIDYVYYITKVMHRDICLSEYDIHMVACQSGATYIDAIRALINKNKDIVNAIMSIIL